MVALKELRLGSLAAESDTELFEYFLVTPVAETLVRERIGLVLGRKGSGKTALFRQTEELLSRQGLSDVRVLRLNMDDHAWAAFQDFKSLGLSEEHAATVSWQLALLLQICIAVAQEPSATWSRDAHADVQVLTQFVRDNFGEISPNLAKSSRLIGQLGSLKVGAFGAGLEATFESDAVQKRDLVPGLTDAISQRLVAPMHDTGWMVVLDQLDESWDGSEDKKSLLVGLLKAVKRINDDFGWRGEASEVRGIRALAFLRTDIHESLRFDDKDKLRDTAIEINWSHDQLKSMLQERFGSVQVDDIFDSKTSQRKGRIPKGSFNYIASRTFMRPRDLLQFLIRIKNAEPDAEKVTKRIVEANEADYSRDKLDDVRQEYRRGAPWVDLALDALKQGPNKFESRTELEARLESRIDRDKLADSGMPSIRDLVEWLTEASILGAARRQIATETIVFRCEGQSVSLEGDSTAWVHPSLFLGLNLSEPRTTRKAAGPPVS